MLQAFEDAVLDQERSGQNIAVMSLQLGLPDPPLLHAWIACAGLPHAYRDPTVRSRFLVHYDEAEHQSTDDIFKARQSHIRGAHLIFHDSLSNQVPSSRHQVLLLEAYIFRTAVNALCDADIGLPYHHLESPLKVLTWAAKQSGRSMVDSCPWIGCIGTKLCDLVFKLSWLINCCPLSPADRVKEQELTRMLANSDELINEEWLDDAQIPHAVQQTRSLYLLACRLLTVLLCPSLPLEIASISTRGISIMSDIMAEGVPKPLMLWPLAILGSGSPRTLREKCSTMIGTIINTFTPGTAGRVQRLFEQTWSADNELGQGARLLLDHNVTSQVFF
ncbi:hypothetical protein C1H76_7571 [Elsinoe australis]|uniref:Uncharacterized protein n=1 Tax=Elsinoe australis TaxID=40998 RepID=A0A4U7APZ2_9PEZI|nr:hypothetical protein C1H76_7571 [Elsinoe australis]